MRLVQIPPDKYDDYRLSLIFDCYKWDPQFLDHNTVATHALVLTQAEYQELKKLTEEYLETMKNDQHAFIASYAPEELPKLERAEVRVFGNYVAYAILSDEDRTLFFDTVEKKLSE